MSRILLLNANYQPLSILSLERAVLLLFQGKVDAASEEAIHLRGKTSTLDVPRVIRLRRYINAPMRKARWSRRAVLARDEFICVYCGIKAGETQKGRMLQRSDMTIDHIKPRAQGGTSTWGNTATACPACNHRKGDRTPEQAGMRLRYEPKIPRVNYVVASGDMPTSWKIYFGIEDPAFTDDKTAV